jgi:hypothetical protein
MKNNIIKNVYFINTGERVGQFFVIIDYKNENYHILALPESESIIAIEKEIDDLIEHKIMEFVEELPDDIYNDCKNEFLYRLNNK